jgi:hypothetical protein
LAWHCSIEQTGEQVRSQHLTDCGIAVDTHHQVTLRSLLEGGIVVVVDESAIRFFRAALDSQQIGLVLTGGT